MPDLARLDEVADRACDVLDRDVGVNAVLGEQVDCFCAQVGQGGVGDPIDLFGAAVEPDGPAVPDPPPVVLVWPANLTGSQAIRLCQIRTRTRCEPPSVCVIRPADVPRHMCSWQT